MSSAIPPGFTLIELIRPSLYLLIIGSVWAAALVPLLCVLLVFSTPTVRRQPIFLMNLFAVIMGIVIGIVNMDIYVADILSPPGEGFEPRKLLAYLGMILFLPLFIDCILALRLYVVYPPRNTSRLQLAIIFIPLIVFKIVRTTNLIIFMVKFAHAILTPDATTAVKSFEQLWDHAPWTKIEWIMQVFDNCYASGFFLWKIYLGRKMEQSAGIVHPTGAAGRSSGDKLKSLFLLALSSFMFPCMFSIAQIILTFRDHDFYIGAYVFVNNLYIEIIGVLLATIWVSKNRSDSSSEGTARTGTQLSSIAYRIPGNNGVKIQTESHVTSSGMASTFSREHEMDEFDITQDARPTMDKPRSSLGHYAA
ncbi:hypothetical protein C8R45DRAFT_13220 [Mycena sanguinolenta]|nr:hypothetical protein C8R45DRAFT_13220 [Mycena sanguinolenta]